MTTSVKVGNRRLLKLAEILDTADAKHKKKGEPTYNQFDYLHDCGTPACAGGHWDWSAQGRRTGGQFQDWMTTFALSNVESEQIFGRCGCGNARTAKQAAQYIRRFVARRQKVAA